MSTDISFEAMLVKEAICAAAAQWERPSVLFRPAVYPDGNNWCALYGRDLMQGVVGFGATPEAAVRDFDENWQHQRLAITGRER